MSRVPGVFVGCGLALIVGAAALVSVPGAIALMGVMLVVLGVGMMRS